MSAFYASHGSGAPAPIITVILIMLAGYIAAAVQTSRRYKPWPLRRYLYWIIGVLCASSAVVGPVAVQAHSDFTAHMAGHLLLGMLSPLFLTLAAPITLLLRSLTIRAARKLTRALNSRPLRVISHPVTASLLNAGGLWILYTTDLYMVMQHQPLLHLLVHLHIWLAGCLFTMTIIYMDPVPHRYGFLYRAGILVAAFAAHVALSKYIYAHPPAGVPDGQAAAGGMLMYYGGDFVEIALVSIFCYQWYKRSLASEGAR
ncbi:cytochrome c oxidase assembly protein [Paenibacillus soyae]|uniref:Cytochrome c oxidase assembly protein n=1 Tax=Paenibacillus soyae TaxID=2969249 RepID=A0A9X2MTZ4_9BACL|nr:cytochrome c oxidase assembly protein [Paenibacillus soyae]MCR2805726.1 cytochrome c oxidase assembly protein [Paenibacillus soyae]